MEDSITIVANVNDGGPSTTSATTATIVTGNVVTGGKGDTGATGAGVPTGGSTGQVLTKNSGTDNDTSWAVPLTLTTTGTSGNATFSSGTLNIPNYAAGSGINRSISSISTNTSAGAASSTDYTYLVSGTTTLTLPTAVGNTNRYIVTNVGSNTVTVGTTSAQTINGASTVTLPVTTTSYDFVSDNANWHIV